MAITNTALDQQLENNRKMYIAELESEVTRLTWALRVQGAALKQIAQAMQSLGIDIEAVEAVSQDVLDLNVSVRVHNSLKRAGIDTVAQLLQVIGVDPLNWYNRMRAIKGLGQGSADELNTVLQARKDQLGISLDYNSYPFSKATRIEKSGETLAK